MERTTTLKILMASPESAPKKCIKFILDYSKSYQVVEARGSKIGLNLN